VVRYWYVGLSLIVVLLLSGAAGAQEAEPAQPRPLLMSAVQDEQFITGLDLYRLNGSDWEAVTTDGYKGGFRLSPTGFMVATLSVPEALRPAIEAGAGWLAGAVWDVQLLDLTTGESRLIAAQPPGFAVDAGGQTTMGVKRSLPVWSPNGSALAWAEQDYPAGDASRLLVYDLVSGETRTLDAELPQVGLSADGLPSDLSWGQGGLVVFTNDPESGVEMLRFYDPQAGLQQRIPVPDPAGEQWRPLADLLWVTFDGAGGQLVVQAGPWVWWRIDPGTVEVTLFCAVLEQVSATDPDASLRLVWDTALPRAPGEWRVVSAGGEELQAFEVGQRPGVVFSPQGERAAWPDEDGITLVELGTFISLTLPAGLSNPLLYWGQAEWRATLPDDLSCEVG